jgi:hypothetical protein
VTPTDWRVFATGVFASAAVELIRTWRFWERNHRVPAQCQKFGFWIIRSLLALTSGILPLIYGVDNLVLALHLGASAPLIFEHLAATRPVLPSQ